MSKGEWLKMRLDVEQARTGGHAKELRVHCERRRAWEAMVGVKRETRFVEMVPLPIVT